MRRALLVIVILFLYLVTVNGLTYAAERDFLGKLFAWFGLEKKVTTENGPGEMKGSIDIQPDDFIMTPCGLDPLPDPPVPPPPPPGDDGKDKG